MSSVLTKIGQFLMKAGERSSTNGLVEFFMDYYKAKGYPWDEEINLIGIMMDRKPKENTFRDYIGAVHSVYGYWDYAFFRGTTRPGNYWIDNPIHPKDGAATIEVGFHKDIWMVGLHRGEPALVQIGAPVRFWRDRNRNGIRDPDEPTQSGYIGLNLHPASKRVPKHSEYEVNRYSAACQVIMWYEDWKQLFEGIIMKTNKAKKKGKFSYLVIDGRELPFTTAALLALQV